MDHHTSPPSPWVLKFADLAPKDLTVLDIACGSGRHARHFLELGYDVTAIDRDISSLTDLETDARLTVLQADLEGAPWPLADQQYGTVIITNYLHRPLFPCIISGLEPDGILIYETFALGNEKFGKPDNPDFLLRPGELREVFSGKFDIIAFEEVEDRDPRPAMRQRICARKQA